MDEEPTCKKRRKVNVELGKSISSADLNIPVISRPCNSKDHLEDGNNEQDNVDSEEQDVGIDQHGDRNDQQNDAANVRQDANVKESAVIGQLVRVTIFLKAKIGTLVGEFSRDEIYGPFNLFFSKSGTLRSVP